MERENIKEILAKEQYPEFMRESTIDKIERFAPAVKNVFNEWYSSNKKLFKFY